MSTEDIDRGDNVELDEDAPPAGDAGDKGADDKGVDAGKGADAGKDDEGAPPSIPKARFDEAVTKERRAREAAEKRAVELETKLAEQQKGVDAAKLAEELDGLEDALDKAIADNDDGEKKRLRAAIREKNKELVQAEARRQGAYATAVAVEQVRYDAAVAALEAAHPEMNPDSDQYDEDMAREMLELKAAYEATGMGSTDALKKAQKLMFPAGKQAPKDDKKDEKELTDDEKREAAEKAAKLKEDAVKRGLETRKKQPPNSAAAGKPSDSKGGSVDSANVSKMTDADFDKLDDDTKSRLRGDMV